MDSPAPSTELRLPATRLIGLSIVGCIVGSLLVAMAVGTPRVGLAGSMNSGLLASAVSVAAVLFGAGPYLAAARGGPWILAVAMLTASIVRAAAAVALGFVVQYALRPEPGSFWLGLGAGWAGAKVVEMGAVLPLLRAAPAPHLTRMDPR